MKKLRWNQTYTARELKITRNYVSMIVRGHSMPSLTLIEFLELKAQTAYPDPRFVPFIDELRKLRESDLEQALFICGAVIKSFQPRD